MHSIELTEEFKLGLIGNPNCGKSSLFNQLTGINQKIGNFPGVTVEKKTGKFALTNGTNISVVDFPGTYSIYPNSTEEKIVVQSLINPKDAFHPDAIVYVADSTHLEHQLLLLTQLIDLHFPIVLALNMSDIAAKESIEIDVAALHKKLGIPIVSISSKTGQGLAELKSALVNLVQNKVKEKPNFYTFNPIEKEVANQVLADFKTKNAYQGLLWAHHSDWLTFLDFNQKEDLKKIQEQHQFNALPLQVEETMARFNHFESLVAKHVKKQQATKSNLTEKIDRILTHRFFGIFIFMAVMALVFQAIFAWASYPMDWIEGIMGYLSQGVANVVPEGWFQSLLIDGVLAGLGGVVIFIPQIAILFFLIGLLEEVGYMARAAFIWDRFMQFFGLNGRSIVALISGGACAIPAMMSARTISNQKEKLITILVTPFISCSARIPVYVVLIGFVVPASTWGIFNLQGLAFLGLYVLGILGALLLALGLKWTLKNSEPSFLALELPTYRAPVMRNVWLSTYEKVKSFILEAGKIILIISILLWFTASYGPSKAMEKAVATAEMQAIENQLSEEDKSNLISSKKLEASYAGHFGKMIEPVIKPLGYDWKIGIALITSFGAREVFVGTMATIYQIGSEEDELRIRDRMALEKDPITGKPIYTLATALSLLIFYVFAMQCMSTLAVMKKETNGWKWPIIMFILMTGIAYISAFMVYQFFS